MFSLRMSHGQMSSLRMSNRYSNVPWINVPWTNVLSTNVPLISKCPLSKCSIDFKCPVDKCPLSEFPINNQMSYRIMLSLRMSLGQMSSFWMSHWFANVPWQMSSLRMSHQQPDFPWKNVLSPNDPWTNVLSPNDPWTNVLSPNVPLISELLARKISGVPNGECIESDKFSVTAHGMDLEWQLCLYPSGKDGEDEEHVSILLELVSRSGLYKVPYNLKFFPTPIFFKSWFSSKEF